MRCSTPGTAFTARAKASTVSAEGFVNAGIFRRGRLAGAAFFVTDFFAGGFLFVVRRTVGFFRAPKRGNQADLSEGNLDNVPSNALDSPRLRA